jgi:hypothetical protein
MSEEVQKTPNEWLAEQQEFWGLPDNGSIDPSDISLLLERYHEYARQFETPEVPEGSTATEHHIYSWLNKFVVEEVHEADFDQGQDVSWTKGILKKWWQKKKLRKV